MKKLKRAYTALSAASDIVGEDKKERGLLGQYEGVNAAFVL